MFRLASLVTVVAAIDDPEWESYKVAFKKTYLHEADEQARYQNFLDSKARITHLNSLNRKVGDAFGLTWTSDRHAEERHAKGLRKPEGFKATAPIYEKKQELRSPASIDWRTTEAVTPIKNQGQCGSCWAFSATEAVESQLALVGGEEYSIELSPQQITSCTPDSGEYGSFGCQGGYTEGAYEYIQSVAGLTNSFYIPYVQSMTKSSQTEACPTDLVKVIDGPDAGLTGGFAAVSGFTYATPPCASGACSSQDLEKLAAALEETPVSVCVNAGVWSDYTGGVLSSSACGSMGAHSQDHCVMATGFNTTAPTPYWIVRNSWSSSWGEKGYIYLEYSENTCGLADCATIPTVALNLNEEQKAKAAVSRERMYSVAAVHLESVSV